MNRGFSLVELSIVLVILGLLTGGILAGQSLIRASELRTLTVDVNRYTAAVNTFRDKYFALPGDMTNATSFWGDQQSGTDACPSAVADGTPGTCNGNGNGQIGSTGIGEYNEYVRVWQHLAMAGLVEGTFSGQNPSLLQSRINVPPTRMGQGSYWIVYTVSVYGRASNSIIIGESTGQIWGPLLNPEEAWNIDTKMDDGRAYYGKAVAWNGYSGGTFPTTGCVATGDVNSATEVNYTLDNRAKTCGMSFFMSF